MDAKVKARWVRALRSGKYKKGRGQLYTQDGKFCCLGVLCHMQRAPKKFLVKKGFSTALEKYMRGLSIEDAADLAVMNDSTGRDNAKSFRQIASYIQKNL